MATEFAPTIATPDGVIFRFGFELLGIKLVPAEGVLTELVADTPVFPIPKSAASLVGLTSLRGSLVPLFDPALIGRTSPDIRPQQRLVLVFGRDDDRAGVLVDAAPVSVSLLPGDTEARIPASVLAPFLLRPWAQLNAPHIVWWEFNHRAAFAFFAQRQVSVADTRSEAEMALSVHN